MKASDRESCVGQNREGCVQLNKLNVGMLVVAIGAGMMFYTYIKFDVFDPSTPTDAALEPDSEDFRNKQSVFNFFKSPQAIPELRFINRKNREITLEAFRGSFVLLNIWATWCAPCREEIPASIDYRKNSAAPIFKYLRFPSMKHLLPESQIFTRN